LIPRILKKLKILKRLKKLQMLNKKLHILIAAILFTALLTTTSGCGDDSKTKTADKKALDKSAPAVKSKEVLTAQPGDLAAGKLVYEKHCHYCHGRKGRGKGAVSVAVVPNPADFIRDEKRMAVSDEGLYKSISHGITKESGGQKLEKALAMPPFMGVLTPKERWDVIAYLRMLVSEATSQESKK
jgi:mono/diheme cytochrome c family protein